MSIQRKFTITFLTTGVILLVVAFLLGISDNPPGIVFFYMGILLLFMALVHRWHQAKNYIFLLIGSFIGFPAFVILDNLFSALSEWTSDIWILSQIFKFLEAFSFLMALMICPIAMIIGITGSLVLYYKNRNRSDISTANT